VIVVTRQALPATSPISESKLGVAALLAAYRLLLRDPSILTVLGANLLRSTGIWAVGTYLATFLVLEHGLSVQQASIAFAAAGAGMFVGSLSAGRPLRAMSPRVLLVGCSAIGTGLVGLTMALPMAAVGVFALVFFGMFLSGMGNVAASLLLLDETTAGPATTMSLNGAILSFASAIGGIAGGILLAVGGYTAIGSATLVLGFLAAALALKSHRHPRPRFRNGVD
jgi:predicted MFS family arabinose efflux permease